MEENKSSEKLREETITIAKSHKASWIKLGQYLHSIYKNKLYKEWGYLSFSVYCKKELNVKENTASKLLKSYLFLEKEEPRFIKEELLEEEKPNTIPNYEAVNLLRLAKQNKNIPTEDFSDLRHAVFNGGEEGKEIRTQVKKILEENNPKDPAEVRRSKRNSVIKRLMTILSSAKRELNSDKLLPTYLLKQMDDLTHKLEDQLE